MVLIARPDALQRCEGEPTASSFPNALGGALLEPSHPHQNYSQARNIHS